MVTNTYSATKVFANAALLLLKNNLVMAKLVDSEGIDKQFTAEAGNGKPGGTVSIKRPPEYIIRDGAVAAPQDTTQGEVAVSIDKYKGVDVQFSSQEMTLSVDQLLKSQSLDSAMAQIASQIDSDLISCVNEFHNWVGTPGNLIDSPTDFFKAPQRMDEMAIPAANRNAILTPGDGYAMAGSLLNLAAQQGDVAKTALQKAEIPLLGNTKPYMTQTVPAITTGTRGATGAVNGANQGVSYLSVRTTYTQSLNIDGLGANATAKKGEVFTIAGVQAVNPRTKQPLGYLQQFTLLADVVASAGGVANAVTISPPIIATGAYQNVSAVPADDAVITWLGAANTTYQQNAAFHKSAIKLVSAKLVMPHNGECSFATDPATGISIRVWRYSDGANDLHNTRFDTIYGVKNVDRRLGVRVSGTP